jgi:hypothetical protein
MEYDTSSEDEQISIIYGMLLGDGGRSGDRYFYMRHCTKQKITPFSKQAC